MPSLSELDLNGTGSCASFNFRRAARAVTSFYDRVFEKQGLISISERSVKRQRFLELTPKGVRIVADCLPAWRKAHEQFVKSVGADYWVGFRNELEKVAHVAVALEASR